MISVWLDQHGKPLSPAEALTASSAIAIDLGSYVDHDDALLEIVERTVDLSDPPKVVIKTYPAGVAPWAVWTSSNVKYPTRKI